MLGELGEDATAVGIARRYAGIAATIVIDRADARLEDSIRALGVHVLVDETVMPDSDGERRFAASLLQRLESADGA
jgi:LPPG:FO 2-phospho-L-lactate transferase